MASVRDPDAPLLAHAVLGGGPHGTRALRALGATGGCGGLMTPTQATLLAKMRHFCEQLPQAQLPLSATRRAWLRARPAKGQPHPPAASPCASD